MTLEVREALGAALAMGMNLGYHQIKKYCNKNVRYGSVITKMNFKNMIPNFIMAIALEFHQHAAQRGEAECMIISVSSSFELGCTCRVLSNAHNLCLCKAFKMLLSSRLIRSLELLP